MFETPDQSPNDASAAVTEESSDGCSEGNDAKTEDNDNVHNNKDNSSNDNDKIEIKKVKQTIRRLKNLLPHLGVPEGGGYWALSKNPLADQTKTEDNDESLEPRGRRRSLRRLLEAGCEPDGSGRTRTRRFRTPILAVNEEAGAGTAATATATVTNNDSTNAVPSRSWERGDWCFLSPSDNDAFLLARSRSAGPYDRKKTARKSSRKNIDHRGSTTTTRGNGDGRKMKRTRQQTNRARPNRTAVRGYCRDSRTTGRDASSRPWEPGDWRWLLPSEERGHPDPPRCTAGDHFDRRKTARKSTKPVRARKRSARRRFARTCELTDETLLVRELIRRSAIFLAAVELAEQQLKRQQQRRHQSCGTGLVEPDEVVILV